MVKPFWSIEEEFLAQYREFERDCEYAENLQDALACGANEVYLDGQPVGWLQKGGGFALFDKFRNVDLAGIKVMLDEIRPDDDGYHVAYYKEIKV